ncbi:hypothetical protein MYX75_04730 [Acidobacteria bacterium AH-259-A15]|nr:hypothetical protein [Acidobacteria bacterium AH-259-A15]
MTMEGVEFEKEDLETTLLEVEVATTIYKELCRVSEEDGLSLATMVNLLFQWYLDQRDLAANSTYRKRFDIFGVGYQRRSAERAARRKYKT